MSSAAEPQDGGALTLGRARAPAWGPEAALSLHSGVLSWPRPQFSGRRCSSRKKGRKRKKGEGAGGGAATPPPAAMAAAAPCSSLCALRTDKGGGERRKS